MLQTCISNLKKLGVLLLLATVVGNGHGTQNVTSSDPRTATPMTATGHNHSVSWTKVVASTTGLLFNSTTGKDGMSNSTTAGVTMSSLGSKETSWLTSVTARRSSSTERWKSTIADQGPSGNSSEGVTMGDIVSGFLIVIFLMAVIVLLIMVIWCMRKKTRQYSFDLYHKEDVDIPLSSVGQGGVFVPNQNDEKPADFEYVSKDESDGAPRESELRAGEERRGPEDVYSEKSDSFGSQIALTPKEKPLEFNFNLTDGEANQSNDTSTDTLGEPQNENNNNTGGRVLSSPDFPTAVPSGAEIFTEISLDEPV